MQLAGARLEVILRRQNVPVELVDFLGRGRSMLAGYVGVCLLCNDSLKGK